MDCDFSLCILAYQQMLFRVFPTEYIFLLEMKQGQCICQLSWSVHCNFTGDGKRNERGWVCTLHPHHPRLILPSSWNVRQKAAVTTLCTQWFFLSFPCHCPIVKYFSFYNPVCKATACSKETAEMPTTPATAHNSRNASNSRNESNNRTANTVWTPSKADADSPTHRCGESFLLR
jgi:hypothetical protein